MARARRSTLPPSSKSGAGSVAAAAPAAIRVRGARQHNLKNIDVDIPRNQLVVMTGRSGSGKSSLAIDTVFAEGQRQYLETLSTYARQFIEQLQRPEVDLVDGLQPTLCIDQRQGTVTPRSTVGTVTEVYDSLRLLMARVADLYCPNCGRPVERMSLEDMVQRIAALPDGTRFVLLAPMVRGQRGQHAEVFARIRQAGLVRARVDGQIVDLEQNPVLAPRKAHTIEAVVDRLIVRVPMQSRLRESLECAAQLGQGVVVVSHQASPPGRTAGDADVWQDLVLSSRHACLACGVSLPELEPRVFSFNSPFGACATCQGIGQVERFDIGLVVPDAGRSLERGAVAPWRTLKAEALARRLESVQPFLTAQRLARDLPFQDWTPRQRDAFWRGSGDWKGLEIILEQELATATHPARQQHLAQYKALVVCPDCQGTRLGPAAEAARLAGHSIHQIVEMPIAEAAEFFASLKLAGEREAIGRQLVCDLRRRLTFLDLVGLGYLTLSRSAQTLSGGEYQRVRLATAIGAGLAGVCYVLDEPTLGLHPRDNARLVAALQQLKLRHNTLLVVEHDEAMMRAADWIIDIGPGAGPLGGHVVATGSVEDIAAHPTSVTGQYLSARQTIVTATPRRVVDPTRSIRVEGARGNNLKNVTVDFPLGALVAVSGVSGSGKSTLVGQTLGPAVARHLGLIAPRPAQLDKVTVPADVAKIVTVDQSPIGRTPRSSAATYLGVFDEIRRVFAKTRQARQRGYGPSRFSFNSRAGWCPACQGHGWVRVEMNFLPDFYNQCDACQGRRFNPQTLQVTFRDRSIADVLELPCEEARALFDAFPKIAGPLDAMLDIGLGYLSLGQPSTTLSGGEAQRIKLAAELARRTAERTVYLLDEPTTGLHFADVQQLVDVLHRLVDGGGTVIVIEHQVDVIRNADWVIELGPAGGAAGGYLLSAGPPTEAAPRGT